MSIENFLDKLSEAMNIALEQGNSFKVKEPSPGDIFDLHIDDDNIERFAYLSTNKIVPLHRIKDGEYVHYTGYSDEAQESVTWLDIVESMEGYDDTTLKVVLKAEEKATSHLDETIGKLTDWAERANDSQQAKGLRDIIDKLQDL